MELTKSCWALINPSPADFCSWDVFLKSEAAFWIPSKDISVSFNPLAKPTNPPIVAPITEPHGPAIIPSAAPVPAPVKPMLASAGPPACSIPPAIIGKPIVKPKPTPIPPVPFMNVSILPLVLPINPPAPGFEAASSALSRCISAVIFLRELDEIPISEASLFMDAESFFWAISISLSVKSFLAKSTISFWYLAVKLFIAEVNLTTAFFCVRNPNPTKSKGAKLGTYPLEAPTTSFNPLGSSLVLVIPKPAGLLGPANLLERPTRMDPTGTPAAASLSTESPSAAKLGI